MRNMLFVALSVFLFCSCKTVTPEGGASTSYFPDGQQDQAKPGLPSDPNGNKQSENSSDSGGNGGDATGFQGRYEGVVEATGFHVVSETSASYLDFSVRRAELSGNGSASSSSFNWDKMLVTFHDQEGRFQIAYFEKNKLSDPLIPPKKGDRIIVTSVVTSVTTVGYEVAFYEGEVYVFLDWPPDLHAAAYSSENDPSGVRKASLMERSFENGGPAYWIRIPWRTQSEMHAVDAVEILIKKYEVTVAIVHYTNTVIDGYKTFTSDAGSGTLRPVQKNTDPDYYIFSSGDPNSLEVPPYHIKVNRDTLVAPFQGKIPNLYAAEAQLGFRTFSIHGGGYDHFLKRSIPPLLLVSIPLLAGICSYRDLAAWVNLQCQLTSELEYYDPTIAFAAHVYSERPLPSVQPMSSGMPMVPQ